jgi:multicomponent Na+:H+ antiporter subunit F
VFSAASIAILATMALALTRALLGPTVYDRILAVNSFGTKTVLIIAVFGFLTERPDFLDIALVYALINFIGTIAVLRFFEYSDLVLPAARPRKTERADEPAPGRPELDQPAGWRILRPGGWDRFAAPP